MKLRAVWFAMIVTAFLASCASMLGPRDVEIPLARLQEAVANRFPFNNRYLELLDIRLTNPHVALQPDSNRILTSMDASIAPPLTNRSWAGNFAVSGQLKFDPSRNALVLGDPRVETFNVSGLDPLYANQIAKVGRLLAEELLKDIPLYTLRPGDLHYAGTSMIPTKITTKANALVVTFEPAR
ncbi:DUF1439 domain-containing protein [Herbaspirillum sp. ST 5-3]|uniref:DUF1439 domain-containing protein n=1 Tax=Oxalobacteraceae TaxID=75682 RepID=UPI001FFEB5AF|nr:DUF1439 domain-containing protein [Herbaspirillum sp. ST 5-3]